MHRRDHAILAVTAVAICASIATSPPPTTAEGGAFADIDIPREGLTETFVVTLTYADDAFASVDVGLQLGRVSDPVTMGVSVDGAPPESVTATDGLSVSTGEIPVDVASCNAFVGCTCTQEVTVTVIVSRSEAAPDAGTRAATLSVFGTISLGDGGPFESTSSVRVSIVP